MSKRAEELVRKIRKTGWNTNNPNSKTLLWSELLTDEVAAALIDAELRRERERCAEQFRLVACPLIFNGRTVKPESCQKCTKMLGPQYCTEVAAILKEEP